MARTFVAVLVSLFAAFQVAALPVGNPRVPDTGLWWVPGENGRFLHLDVGPDGYVFATVSGFVDGTATYLVMQGPMALAPVDESSTRPVVGSLASPLYEVADGPCFGCAWSAPRVRQSSLGSGTLTFFASDELRLDAFGRSTTFRRFPLFTTQAATPEDRHIGRWMAVLRTSAGVVRDTVDIARADGALEFRFPSRPGPDLPSRSEASLAPCGSNRIALAADGSFHASSAAGPGCAGDTYIFHERDGALYGQRRASNFAGRIASEVLLYRVPPRWTADPVSQSTAPGNPRLPDPGLWWIEGENGRFLHLDVGPDGYAFATVSGFVDGVASYLVAQGPLQPVAGANPAERPVLATLESPLYEVAGGSCFECEWHAPAVRASEFGSARLTFFLDNTIEVEAFGVRSTYHRFPLFTTTAADVPQRYAGRWQAVMRNTYGGITTEVVDLALRDDGQLWYGFPIPPPLGVPRLWPELQPCGNGRMSVDRNGALTGVAGILPACTTRTHDFHERDGAIYGQQHPSDLRAASTEVLFYRIPADW